MLSLAITTAWLAAGSAAEAIPPLPYTQIDEVDRERHTRIEMLYVLPEWANADLGRPLSVDEHGLGYFARNVDHLKEYLERERGERRDERRANVRSKESKGRRGGPPTETRGRPEHPRLPGGQESRFGDQPILPEPVEWPLAGVPSGNGRPGTGEVPEPSAPALFAIAAMGWLAVMRPGRPR